METQGIHYQAMPMGGGWGDGFGGGFGGLIAGALLARGGFGEGRRFGGDDCGNCVTPAALMAGLNNVTDSINNGVVISKLGSIEGAIPLAGMGVQNSICEQTNALQGSLSSLALGTQQGFSNVKDAVQNGTLANAVGFATTNSGIAATEARLSAQMCAGFHGIQTLVNQLNTENLNRELTVAQLDARDERNFRRSRETEINVTNTNTATAAQAQIQTQLQQQGQILAGIVPFLNNLANDIQVVRQTQSNVNFGVQAGTTQTNAATNNAVN